MRGKKFLAILAVGVVVLGLLALVPGGVVGSGPGYQVYGPQVLRAALPTATLVPTVSVAPSPTWTAAATTPTPTRTATPRPSNCHPSYPTVCIPPPPPDLDCGQIPYRNFTVLRPDVHRFDGDGDGVGCET